MNTKKLKLAWIIPAFAGLFLMGFTSTSSLSVTEAAQEEVAKTGVHVENDTFNFGTISREGEKVNALFVVVNATDSPISLASVNASCGCTTTDWKKEPIAPGAKGEIKVAFNPKGQFGTINKRVTAKTDSGVTLTMYIKGIVE